MAQSMIGGGGAAPSSSFTGGGGSFTPAPRPRRAPRAPSSQFDGGGGTIPRHVAKPKPQFDGGSGSFGDTLAAKRKAALATRLAGATAGGSGGSGGGGGGGAQAAALAAPAVPKVNLQDFINDDPQYTAAQNAAKLSLDDYDAATLQGTQQVQADQASQKQQLQTALLDLHNSTADDFAARGMERSGLMLGAEDRVDAQGVQQGAAIDQLLTDFTQQRGQGRLSQEQKNRDALNKVIQAITDNYYKQQQTAG